MLVVLVSEASAALVMQPSSSSSSSSGLAPVTFAPQPRSRAVVTGLFESGSVGCAGGGSDNGGFCFLSSPDDGADRAVGRAATLRLLIGQVQGARRAADAARPLLGGSRATLLFGDAAGVYVISGTSVSQLSPGIYCLSGGRVDDDDDDPEALASKQRFRDLIAKSWYDWAATDTPAALAALATGVLGAEGPALAFSTAAAAGGTAAALWFRASASSAAFLSTFDEVGVAPWPPVDPRKPAGYHTAYNLFASENRVRVKDRLQAEPDYLRNSVNLEISALWAALPPEQKEEFEQRSKQDKLRFLRAVASYVPSPGYPREAPRCRPPKGYDEQGRPKPAHAPRKQRPKIPKSAYQVYAAERHRQLGPTMPDINERLAVIGAEWTGLDAAEHQRYRLLAQAIQLRSSH